MNAKEYKDRFDRLYSNLLGACDTFYSWKGLQNKDHEPIYDQAKYFWSAILIALQNEWLLSLARCFEDSRYSERDDVISVRALLKHHPDPMRAQKVKEFLKRHEKVIVHISRLRDYQLAHLNAEHLATPGKLLQKFPIVYGEVEALLVDFPELFSLLNPDPGIGYVLDNYTKEPEREAKYTMTKIQYFDKKRKEHVDRFVSGEIDDPSFPSAL